MNQITNQERDGIYYVRSLANSMGMSLLDRAIMKMIGTRHILYTEAGEKVAYKFFGKFYSI